MTINLNPKNLVCKKAPFPHVVIDNIISNEDMELLTQEIENISNHTHHKSGHRLSVQFGTQNYQNYLLNAPVSRTIDGVLRSKVFFNTILDTFDKCLCSAGLNEALMPLSNLTFTGKRTEFVITTNLFKRAFIRFFYNPILRGFKIRRFFRKLNALISGHRVYPLVSFSISKGGYVEKAHTDARHKMFVGLIYLDDISTGGEICILKSKSKQARLTAYQYPSEVNLSLHEAIKIKKGKCLIFMNTNDAYHATVPFEGNRRFIYFAFAVTGVESAFISEPVVKLGDQSR